MKAEEYVPKAVEVAIRIGVLFVLAWWCFRILQPFVFLMIWGIILAIAMRPAHSRLADRLGGGRTGVAAMIVTIVMLVVLVVPAVFLTETLLAGAKGIATGLQDGTLHVPRPADGVNDWPLVGPQVHDLWASLSANLGTALEPVRPQLRAIARWLVGAMAGAGLGVLGFLVSVVISGIFLANVEAGGRTAHAIGRRLAGARGDEFVDLAGLTIRSVACGILGVALIQAVLAGLGFLAIGIPGAGLWALVALFLSIIQVGTLPIALPIVIYVFFTAEPLVAVIFLVWNVVVGLLDNVLKPLLLGRGSPVPTMVIFLGAIGGFLSAGIVGLFVGAVILALGYRVFLFWLYQDENPSAGETP
jgi:predicted PurR-regulated permease PerM